MQRESHIMVYVKQKAQATYLTTLAPWYAAYLISSHGERIRALIILNGNENRCNWRRVSLSTWMQCMVYYKKVLTALIYAA